MDAAIGSLHDLVERRRTGADLSEQADPSRPALHARRHHRLRRPRLAQKLGDTIGQPVVAENKPGAGGILGTDTVARSAPDGYTIVIMDPAIVINPTLQSDVPYDLFKNLQTVSIVSSSSEVLVVSPHLGVKTFQELVAYGKANPGKLNFASAGIGTTPHLAGELFKMRTGIDATHIPYKGIGASYTDMMSGKVQMAFSSIAGALPFTKDNRVIPSQPRAAPARRSIRIFRRSPKPACRVLRSTSGSASSRPPDCRPTCSPSSTPR